MYEIGMNKFGTVVSEVLSFVNNKLYLAVQPENYLN